MGGALLLFGGWYFLSARKWVTGPVREETADAELAAILGEASQRQAHQQQFVHRLRPALMHAALVGAPPGRLTHPVLQEV